VAALDALPDLPARAPLPSPTGCCYAALSQLALNFVRFFISPDFQVGNWLAMGGWDSQRECSSPTASQGAACTSVGPFTRCRGQGVERAAHGLQGLGARMPTLKMHARGGHRLWHHPTLRACSLRTPPTPPPPSPPRPPHTHRNPQRKCSWFDSYYTYATVKQFDRSLKAVAALNDTHMMGDNAHKTLRM